MKYFTATKLFMVLLGTGVLLVSCKKEHDFHKKPFKVQTANWYRVAPTTPVPVTINGIDYAGFAYFPGGGTGNATHIGNCSTFFNQLTYGTSPDAPPAGSVAASLKDVPGYPVTVALCL